MRLVFCFGFSEEVEKKKVREKRGIESKLADENSFSLSPSLAHRYASTLARSRERASVHLSSASSSCPEAKAACAARRAALRDMQKKNGK